MCSLIKPGDILIFKAGDDWVGKSIAWLTRSDVSHAAMAYEQDTIVEMGSKGISVSRIDEMPGDDAYILRLESEPDSAPLLKAAKVYINAETRYDFPALVILAGLLVYRSIRPTPKLAIITDTILRAACKLLDDLIQRLILKNPNKAMVCSQLVYQIYRDCGNPYSIELKGGDLQASDALDAANHAETQDGFIRLADMLDDTATITSDMAFMNGDAAGIEEDPDELSRMLFEALEESDKTADLDMAAINFGQVVQMARKFAELLEKLLETSEIDIPIDALFVTPGDILYHAKNLRSVGNLDIKRLAQ